MRQSPCEDFGGSLGFLVRFGGAVGVTVGGDVESQKTVVAAGFLDGVDDISLVVKGDSVGAGLRVAAYRQAEFVAGVVADFLNDLILLVRDFFAAGRFCLVVAFDGITGKSEVDTILTVGCCFGHGWFPFFS